VSGTIFHYSLKYIVEVDSDLVSQQITQSLVVAHNVFSNSQVKNIGFMICRRLQGEYVNNFSARRLQESAHKRGDHIPTLCRSEKPLCR